MLKIRYKIIFIIVIFVLSIPIFKQIYYAPLNFDESFNLQIPVSFLKTGQYKSMYMPEKPYDARISVGYPLHIGQVVFFKLIGINRYSARFYSIFLFVLLLFVVYKLLNSYLAVLFLQVLFFVSPTFASLASFYLGENFALLNILISLYLLIKKKNIFLSALFFSFAVHLKIHAIVLLPVYVFLSENKLNYIGYFFMLCIGGFLVFFLSTYAFGYTHVPIILYIKQFYWDYKLFLRLNSGIDTYNMVSPLLNLLNNILNFTNNIFNIGILLITLVTVKKYKTWVFPTIIVICYALLFKGVKNMQFLSLGLFFLSLLNMSGRAQKYILLFFIIINIPFIINPIRNINNLVLQNTIITRKQEEVALYVRKLKGDIYTNNWWQIPEISFLSGRTFKDRMQYKGKKDGYLFFSSLQDKSYWPTADMRKACRKMVFCKYNYGICRLNKSFEISENIYPMESINNPDCPIL